MFAHSPVRLHPLHPLSILTFPFPSHAEGGEQAGLSGALEPAASARSPEATSLSIGLISDRSRSLYFR